MYKTYKLGDILTESKIISEKSDPDKRITVKLNVNGVEKRPFKNDVKWATRYYVRKQGQFIYGKQNLHKWAFWIVPENLDWFETTSDIPTFDINTKICLPELIMYFFRNNDYYKTLESIAKGVWSKRIHPKQIFELEIKLPWITEQTKLLNQVIEQEKSIKEALNINDENLNYIKLLRQSILQEAIEWKLTKTWREDNKSIDSAAILLREIQNEKEELIKLKKIKKQKELKKIEWKEIPFNIPEKWSWCRLGKICTLNYWKWFDKKDISDKWRFPVYGANWITKYSNNFLVEWPSLIVWRKWSVWSINIELWKFWPSDVTYYINDFEFKDFYYFYYLLKSLNLPQYWTGIKPWLNRDLSYNLLIPFPPIKEQKEIARIIEEFMKNCDNLEKESINIKEKLEKLLSTVLWEVFSWKKKDNLIKVLPGIEIENVKITNNIWKIAIKHLSFQTFKDFKDYVDEALKSDGNEKPKNNLEVKSYNLLWDNMEILEILKENKKVEAIDLWKSSKYSESIEEFYAELKKLLDENKIKEFKNGREVIIELI